MRKSKGLKFSYLVVLFVCIATFFSGMITSLRSIGSSSVGTITSYMHDDKKLIVSPWLSPMNQKRLCIYTGLVVSKLPLDEKRKEYLKYHREYVFKS